MMDRELLRSALATTADCLSADQLQAHLDGDAAKSSVTAEKHLAQCPRCQAELALLKTFDASEPLPDEGAGVAWISAKVERNLPRITGRPESRGSRLAGSPWWALVWKTTSGRFALAASAVAIIVIASGLWFRPQAPVIIADAGKHDLIARSEQIAKLEPAGDMTVKPAELRWQVVPNAATYKVDVMEVDETVIWTSQSSNNAVGLPINVREKMLPGKAMLWRVAAMSADGNIIATSQTERFRVISPTGNSEAR